MSRVLVLFAATPDPSAAMSAAFGESDVAAVVAGVLGSPVEVSVVTWAPPPAGIAGIGRILTLADRPVPAVDRFLAAIGVRRLRDHLARSPAGRLLNSLGPADAGRAFWRTLRRAPAALELAGPEVIVIAGDLAATRAAWNLLRRGAAARALWGTRAAVDELARSTR